MNFIEEARLIMITQKKNSDGTVTMTGSNCSITYNGWGKSSQTIRISPTTTVTRNYENGKQVGDSVYTHVNPDGKVVTYKNK